MAMDSGLNSWRHSTNHNRMIELQQHPQPLQGRDAGLKLEYFAGSAFRLTTPAGISIMLDPWRNLPTQKWDWYFHDFPATAVDIGVSTHAHFDHDALHRLDASVLLDRLIGSYEFGDVKITGIADKHATDASYASYDFRLINEYFGGQKLFPPDNSRSWDNCLIKIETGGLTLLHWGDNRHNPPEDVWRAIGQVDIVLLPIDDSQHVLGDPMVEEIIARLSAAVVIPHHYYIWNVVQRQSTLMPVAKWLKQQPRKVRHLADSAAFYQRSSLPKATVIDYFADHVAFDVNEWHHQHGISVAE